MLEKRLLNENLHISGCAFRNKGVESFQTPKEAKQFFIDFLILETISGVKYTKTELFVTYLLIRWLVAKKKVILSSELPYHPKKKRPVQDKEFVLSGCVCKIRQP